MERQKTTQLWLDLIKDEKNNNIISKSTLGE